MTVQNVDQPPSIRLSPSPDAFDLHQETFFPVTDIENRARVFINRNPNNPAMSKLIERIRNCVGMLDLYRNTGFSLCEPNSVLRSLRCAFLVIDSTNM